GVSDQRRRSQTRRRTLRLRCGLGISGTGETARAAQRTVGLRRSPHDTEKLQVEFTIYDLRFTIDESRKIANRKSQIVNRKSQMNLTLKVWRQKNATAPGRFEAYEAKDLLPEMSFLEMLDVVNEELIERDE